MINNPTTLAEFWYKMPIRTASFSLGGATVSSRTEGGDTITARRGSRLWSGSVALAPMAYRDAEPWRARLSVMADAGQSFLCYPMPIYSSAYDPNGDLESAPVKIYTLPASGVEIRLEGVPTGYEIKGGEFLSFTYGSNPVRYALHQVVTGTYTAGGDGRTAALEVRPAIRPGAVVGAAVRLYKARMNAVIVPDSIIWGSSSGLATDGISFSFIQTLRG